MIVSISSCVGSTFRANRACSSSFRLSVSLSSVSMSAKAFFTASGDVAPSFSRMLDTSLEKSNSASDASLEAAAEAVPRSASFPSFPFPFPLRLKREVLLGSSDNSSTFLALGSEAGCLMGVARSSSPSSIAWSPDSLISGF